MRKMVLFFGKETGTTNKVALLYNTLTFISILGLAKS